MTVEAYNRYLKAWLPVLAIYTGYDGKDHYVYGSETLTAFGELLNRRVKAKKQNNILYVGETGSGKSTAAIQVCRAQEHNWSVSDNYIYTIEDLQRKYSDPESHSPISLIDEASIVLNSLDFMTKGAKSMVGLMDTMRSLGFSTHMCAPDMYEINSKVRNIHVDYLLMMPATSPLPGYEKRGFCNIYRHVRRDWGKGAYSLMATCIFDDLPPRVKKEYEPIKKAKQLQLLKDFSKESTGVKKCKS